MLSITKKTLLVLILLILPSLVAIAINWQWSPQSLNTFSKSYYWLTQSAGIPWAVLTCGFCYFLFAFLLKANSKILLFKLLVVLVFAVLFGQVVKSTIKTVTSQPRPFVVWMAQTYDISEDHFYSIPRSERKTFIEQHVSKSALASTTSSTIIPTWLSKHWISETGYSFPSGHMMFAATWAFLAILLLGFKRHFYVVTAIVIWAELIGISRLMLGMHYPIDLIFGSLVAWLVAVVSYYLAYKLNLTPWLQNRSS